MSTVAPAGVESRALPADRYETERPDVERHVPLSARRVLDLGCCTGTLGAALKRRQDVTVVGVEIDPACAAVASSRLDRVVVSDVELFLASPAPAEAPFDCLLAADVLEHLVDPWLALERAVELLAPGATVVISLPNVTHYRAIWRVLREGRWPREDVGLFDRTHLRWFTLEDGLELLRGAGLRPTSVEPNYWSRPGWRVRVWELLSKTPLYRFIPVQFVLAAVKPST